jgi:Astacin (Peptidase family M12A)
MQIIVKVIIFGIVATSIMGCKSEFPIVEWEDGIIPYYLTGDFTDQEIQYIQTAMEEWEQTCGVHFQEVTPRARAYNIIRIHEKKWSSSIGENNSVCYMNFGDGHSPQGHIIHELGHALGLLHEHQRPDRDQFITILWDNIIPSYHHNFEIRDNPLLVEENHDYDYQSIMHYPEDGFSIDLTATMVSLFPDNPINRLDVITEKDSAKAREIYGPPKDE